MNRNRVLFAVLTAAALSVSLFARSSTAQSSFDRKAFVKKFLDASANIPAKHRSLLSSGMQNFLAYAAAVNADHAKNANDGGTLNIPARALNVAKASAQVTGSSGPGGTIQISNPALDFIGSVTSGFTQSETSSAWCGNSVVAGYNDSGALLRTIGVNPLGAASISGVSFSTDGGRIFTDLGFLNPGTDPANFLLGDPKVSCTSASQFYYSNIFAAATPPDSNGNRNPLTAVSVSSSSNSGASWAAPVAAVTKSAFTHILDKPWSAVDPTNPMRLYVTYTDFDFTFPPTGTCANDFRIAIELVSSADGGNTWGAPVVIDEQCGASLNGVQGSNVVVSPTGHVYVAYEFFPGLVPNNNIYFRTSTDNGMTFSAPVNVSDVVPNGQGGILQGGFRNNEFPQVAVDRTRGSSNGTIYVTWSDGRDNVVPDLASFTGTYAFPDIFVSKSVDGGMTFSTPQAISPTPASFTGIGRDQFMPGIAVDGGGRVGVCYYDRRSDPGNTVIDRFCSASFDQGATWHEQRVSFSNWLPLHASDVFLNLFYMGDYDALSSDFTLRNAGFFTTFEIQNNGNPDVVGKKL